MTAWKEAIESSVKLMEIAVKTSEPVLLDNLDAQTPFDINVEDLDPEGPSPLESASR
jgi:hypothetical protein